MGDFLTSFLVPGWAVVLLCMLAPKICISVSFGAFDLGSATCQCSELMLHFDFGVPFILCVLLLIVKAGLLCLVVGVYFGWLQLLMKHVDAPYGVTMRDGVTTVVSQRLAD